MEQAAPLAEVPRGTSAHIVETAADEVGIFTGTANAVEGSLYERELPIAIRPAGVEPSGERVAVRESGGALRLAEGVL